MTAKPPGGYWDIDESTSAENIEAILHHFANYTNAPIEAVNALRRALAERDAHIANIERRQSGQPAPSAPDNDQVRAVDMPAAQRAAYTRIVQLVEFNRVCRHCGRSEVVAVYPTAKPTLCDRPECIEAERQRGKRINAERQRRFRQRRGKGSNTDE
jgi:hypothetical protein